MIPFRLQDTVPTKRKSSSKTNYAPLTYNAHEAVDYKNAMAVLKASDAIPADANVRDSTDANTIARLVEAKLEEDEEKLLEEYFPLGLSKPTTLIEAALRGLPTKSRPVVNKPSPKVITNSIPTRTRLQLRRPQPTVRKNAIKPTYTGILKARAAPKPRVSQGIARIKLAEKAIKHDAEVSSIASDSVTMESKNARKDSRMSGGDGDQRIPRFRSTRWRVPRGHRKIAVVEARKKRLQMKSRKKKCDRMTYLAILIVSILRIITTLLEVHQSDEHWMLLETLKNLYKINCIEVYDWPLNFRSVSLYLYFLAQCLLPITVQEYYADFYLLWLAIQSWYTGIRIAYLPRQYVFKETLLPKEELIWQIVLFVLDIFCFIAVMIRFYHMANPVKYREKYSNTLLGDYLVNDYIQFMVQSSFIRKKTAMQRATAFQVLTVVRKLKEKYRTTGTYPSQATIDKEVDGALRALADWKKFPALRIIHAFEVKEQLMNEKSKLRRDKIREMKEKFDRMLAEYRNLPLEKDEANEMNQDKKVVINPIGVVTMASKQSSDDEKDEPSVSSVTLDTAVLHAAEDPQATKSGFGSFLRRTFQKPTKSAWDATVAKAKASRQTKTPGAAKNVWDITVSKLKIAQQNMTKVSRRSRVEGAKSSESDLVAANRVTTPVAGSVKIQQVSPSPAPEYETKAADEANKVTRASVDRNDSVQLAGQAPKRHSQDERGATPDFVQATAGVNDSGKETQKKPPKFSDASNKDGSNQNDSQPPGSPRLPEVVKVAEVVRSVKPNSGGAAKRPLPKIGWNPPVTPAGPRKSPRDNEKRSPVRNKPTERSGKAKPEQVTYPPKTTGNPASPYSTQPKKNSPRPAKASIKAQDLMKGKTVKTDSDYFKEREKKLADLKSMYKR